MIKQIWLCLSRPYPFIFFKGGLSQNLLSPFWSTLSHMMLSDLWQEKELTVKKCELKQLVACWWHLLTTGKGLLFSSWLNGVNQWKEKNKPKGIWMWLSGEKKITYVKLVHYDWAELWEVVECSQTSQDSNSRSLMKSKNFIIWIQS